MEQFYLYIDPYVIFFYRVWGVAIVDFFFGTFILALVCVVLGELTMSVAFLFNRRQIDEVTGDVVRYQNLSIDALGAKDKRAYTACNEQANDAFGKSFFQQLALAASSLWPIPFALGWMQLRFLEVEFPVFLTGAALGYIGLFIPIYILARIAFGKVKHRLPYFSRMHGILETYSGETARMKSFTDLAPKHGAESAVKES